MTSAGVGADGQESPVQGPERCVLPVEIVAPVGAQEAVGEPELVHGQAGVALQVQGLPQVHLELAVAAAVCESAVMPRSQSGDGASTASRRVLQQEMFSHLALTRVELAKSFWPRKPRAAPIVAFSQREAVLEAYVEHLVLRLQVIDVEEAVGLPGGLLVDAQQLVLRQQGAELLEDGVQLVLVAEAPAAEELRVNANRHADEAQLLGADPSAYLEMPAADKQRVQRAVRLVELRRVCEIVYDHQNLVEPLHLQLLAGVGDLALLLDDAPQRRLVPIVPVGLFALCVHAQVLLDVALDGDPPVVDVDRGTENVHTLEDAAILLQYEADQRHSFAAL